jgi:3',5'-cyclic AMP phosphodiesterase CpdA
VHFVVFGDSGGGPLQGAVRDQLDTVRFDLMLHVGDIAYGSGTLAELESQFFAEYASILGNVPVFPTSGNHDYETEGGAPFRQVFALPENGMPGGVERWYSFDWGDVHFVALDTERVDATQTAWLEDDLSRNLLPWTIVYLHRPPYSSGDHGSAAGVRRAFTPLFADYGVDVVFAGHDHDYERTDAIDGVTYIVTGGGGHGTRPVGRSSFTAYSEDVLHFVYGEVTTERMLLHAIDASGREFDSVSIDRAAPLVPR